MAKKKDYFWFKRVFGRLNQIFTLSRFNPTIFEAAITIKEINNKLKNYLNTKKDYIDLSTYKKHFDFLAQLGLSENFEVNTTHDNLILRGTSIKPILLSSNQKKVIIFCHGFSNNRWSPFYCIHLALQAGYQIITYDARNHGLSDKSYTSLGQVESDDLQDIIDYVKKKYQPEKIGLYGFSMGAVTCLLWTGCFGNKEKSKVVLAICDSPFDSFLEQSKFALGSGVNYYWKRNLATKLVYDVLNTSYQVLEKINLLDNLPSELSLNLLLLHGLEDQFINWEASLNIWNKLQENKSSKKKVILYLCRHANHGEIPFIGDYLPKSLLYDGEKVSRFTFSNLFVNYLRKNF